MRGNITNKHDIDELFRFARLNSFNHLIVQVRGRGDAYYQSRLVPKGQRIRDKSFDPLALIIEQAQRENIKVHAWVNMYLLWSDQRMPQSDQHLLLHHSDWLDIEQAGVSTPASLVADMEKLREGHEGLYLSPGHPQVADHLVEVCRELLTNYAVDGLHLDYIRYQDADFGRNPVARQLYKKYNGDDPQQLQTSPERWVGNERQYSAKIRKWNEYRRHQVTDLVKQIDLMKENIRPNCVLSAAVKPNLYQAKNQFFQEWDVWLAAGYMDWVFPMNYTADLRAFAANIDIIYDNLPQKYRQRIIMGLATYNQPAADVVDKLLYTRITRFTGISLFSYNTFSQQPGYIRHIYHEMNR